MTISELNVYSAKVTLNANLDRGLAGSVFNSHLNKLVEQQKVFIAQLDFALKRALEVKSRLAAL